MLCTTPTVEHVSRHSVNQELPNNKSDAHLKGMFCIHNAALKEKLLPCWMLCLRLQMGDEESREQLIKTHYMTRVGELTTQLQISDSKAVHFHSEVKLLQQCLSQ